MVRTPGALVGPETDVRQFISSLPPNVVLQ